MAAHRARPSSSSFSLPFLYQSSRSHAPLRGPRVTWRRLVEERKGKRLGARNAAAAKFESWLRWKMVAILTLSTRSVTPYQKTLQPSSSPADCQAALALFFFGSPFFVAAPLDTLDPAAILKLYDFCVFSFDKWQRTARAPLPPPSPFLSSTNLREVTLP